MTATRWVGGSLGTALILCASLAVAQEQQEPAASAPAASGQGLGGFFGRIRDSVAGVIGSPDPSKPALQSLKPGVYVKSNESIGDERDLHERRITHGLVQLRPLTDYANEVLDRLKAASGVSGVPGKVVIAANDQLDAGATADGNIYVSIGYFRSLTNEDQLAALLGHELAHVLLRHHDSNMFGRMQKQMSSWFTAGASVRNDLERAINGGSSSTLSPGQKEALSRMDLAIKLNDRVLHPSWGRKQESEADKLGMDIMVKAGYSFGDGMRPWLSLVRAWDEQQAKVRAELEAQKQASVEALAAQNQLDKAMKAGLDNAFQQTMEQISASHESGEKRLDDIDAYAVAAYGDNVPAHPRRELPYQQMMKRAEVKQTIDAYREAFTARNLVIERKFSEALPALRRLTGAGSPIASHALPNYLMFEALRGLGRTKEGEPFIGRAIQAPEPTWEPLDSAASYYRDINDPGKIVPLGQAGFTRFSAAPSAYPRLIALYAGHGLPEAARQTLVECQLKEPERYKQCAEAAKR